MLFFFFFLGGGWLSLFYFFMFCSAILLLLPIISYLFQIQSHPNCVKQCKPISDNQKLPLEIKYLTIFWFLLLFLTYNFPPQSLQGESPEILQIVPHWRGWVRGHDAGTHARTQTVAHAEFCDFYHFFKICNFQFLL